MSPAQAANQPVAQATAPDAPKSKRTLTGKVVSTKMAKTVTVLVERKVQHPVYGKTIVRSTKMHAHVASGQFKDGDIVEIEETRPISKTKAWVVTKLLSSAAVI